MKKIILMIAFSLSANIYSAVEILDRVAVIVDDGLIMESQIKSSLLDMQSRYEQQDILKPEMGVLREQVIESLIIEELQLQLAQRAGVRISDTELNNSIIRIANNNQMVLEEFIAYIEENGESYEELRENVRKQMIIQRIQRGRVGSEIDITEKEFNAFLATDESLDELEPELLVMQILVKDIQQANNILLRLEGEENFSDIAKSESLSSNAASGGIMEWRKLNAMPELFANALDNRKVGYITQPIETGAGYHILKLEEKRGPLVQYENQWLSRHILLSPSTIRDEQSTKEELDTIRTRIINGESFSKLAEEYSEDPGSALKGGELEWMGKGITAAEFEKTFTTLEIGIISEVFETEFGFHFLEVLGKRNKDMTKDAIENRAFNILYSRKYDEELENSLRSMRAEAFVEIKDLD